MPVVIAGVAAVVVGGGLAFWLLSQSGVPASVAASPSASPSETRIAVPAEVVDEPALMDVAEVPSAEVLLTSTVDTQDQRGFSVVRLDATPALEQAQQTYIDEATGDYEAQIFEGVDNEINIGADFVLATSSVVGLRVETMLYGGGAHALYSSRALYAFPDDGGAAWSPDMIGDADTLAGWVSGALADAGLAFTEVPPDHVVNDVRFMPDGAITVTLEPGADVAFAAGAVTVRVDPEAASAVLSELGATVRDAAISGDPFEAPQEPVALPSAPGPSGGGGEVDCSQLRCIALTFDDGPGPHTARLLDELADKDVKVTFFLVGRSAAASPDLVAREVAEGHVVGNHTWSHPDLRKLGPADIATELAQTNDAIVAASGVTPVLVRPPYGAVDDTVMEALGAASASAVLWDVDTEDWKNLDAGITTQRALDGAHDGAIILMHDIHPSTVDAVPGIIDQLRDAGYTLVTVPQLLGESLTPGQKYFGG